MASVYTWSFTGVFILFILIGFLLGLWRGLKRSLLRFISVFISAFIAYFITVPVTKAVLNIDVSSFGWVIGGVTLSTVNDTLLAIINQIPYVSDIVNLSSTFKSFLLYLPQIIVNIVLFVLLFIIICLFMWIIYRIVAHFVAPKKDKNGDVRKKYRLAGAGIGAVQGLLFFIVLLIPVLSIVNLISTTTDTIDEYNDAKQSKSVAVYVETPSNDEGFSALSVINEAENKDSKIINTTEIHKYLDPVKNVWVVKTFNAIKIGALSDKVFDGFSKLDIKGTKTTLRAEVNTLTNLVIKFNDIKNLDLNNLSDDDVDKLNETVNYVFSSPLLKNVIGEALPNAASKWMSANDAVIGLTKPNLGDNLTPVVDSLLKAISVESVEEVEKDIKAVPSVLKVSSQSGLLTNLKEGGDSAFKAMSDKTNVTNLIDAMLGGPALKQVLPSLFNTGLEFVYPLIDVPETDEEIDQIFYEKLIKANEISADSSARENAYRDALRYYDVTIYEDGEVPTPVPARPFITKTQFDSIISNCSLFNTRTQFETYFTSNNIAIKRGMVVSKGDLVITKKSNQINWETEKVILANIFSGFYNVYDQNNSKGEGETALDSVDFEVFANVLDNIRKSQLLDGIDQKLVLSFLQSSIMEDLSIGDGFMNMVKDDEKFETVDFHKLFNTLTVVKNLKSNDQSLSKENVDSLLKTLTSTDEEDKATKDAILDMADEDNLKKSGVSDNQASAISTIVKGISEVTNTDTSESDRDAFEAAVDAMENSETESFSSKEDVKKFVNSLMSSEIVYKAVVNNNDYKVITSHTDWVQESCTEYYNNHSDCDTTKLSSIAEKCGTTWSNT